MGSDWTRAERPVRRLGRGGAGLSGGRARECGEEQEPTGWGWGQCPLRTRVAQMPVSTEGNFGCLDTSRRAHSAKRTLSGNFFDLCGP